MIKSIFVGRRAAGCSREAAMRHLLEVHGPMVVCRPADAGPAPEIYVQNHVFDGVYPESGAHGIERDLVTEFWFDSVEAMRESGQTPYYLANMKPDEPRFVTTASVARMRVAETTIVDGARRGHKLFVMASRAARIDDAAWDAACVDSAGVIAGARGVTALVRNDVVFPTDDTRFVDVILEAWLSDRQGAAALLDRSDAVFAAFGPCIERVRSLALAAEEFDAYAIRTRHAAHRR